MSLAMQMSEYIKDQIYNYTHTVFESLGHNLDKEKIWHDFAEVRPGFFKSTFYVSGLDNVKRKDFSALSEAVKQAHDELKQLKVKSKRPNKEVRFYIEVNKNKDINDI